MNAKDFINDWAERRARARAKRLDDEARIFLLMGFTVDELVILDDTFNMNDVAQVVPKKFLEA